MMTSHCFNPKIFQISKLNQATRVEKIDVYYTISPFGRTTDTHSKRCAEPLALNLQTSILPTPPLPTHPACARGGERKLDWGGRGGQLGGGCAQHPPTALLVFSKVILSLAGGEPGVGCAVQGGNSLHEHVWCVRFRLTFREGGSGAGNLDGLDEEADEPGEIHTTTP